MANTYTKIDIQLVFAVKGRQSLIHKSWKEELNKYITGIVQTQGHKMLIVNGMPDHIHIFIGYNHNQLISDLVEEIKTSSNKFIKTQGFCPQHFSWQNGYGAFSYGRSQRNTVIRYIENQEEHHRKKTFKAEYIKLLEKFEVEYILRAAKFCAWHKAQVGGVMPQSRKSHAHDLTACGINMTICLIS